MQLGKAHQSRTTHIHIRVGRHLGIQLCSLALLGSILGVGQRVCQAQLSISHKILLAFNHGGVVFLSHAEFFRTGGGIRELAHVLDQVITHLHTDVVGKVCSAEGVGHVAEHLLNLPFHLFLGGLVILKADKLLVHGANLSHAEDSVGVLISRVNTGEVREVSGLLLQSERLVQVGLVTVHIGLHIGVDSLFQLGVRLLILEHVGCLTGNGILSALQRNLVLLLVGGHGEVERYHRQHEGITLCITFRPVALCILASASLSCSLALAFGRELGGIGSQPEQCVGCRGAALPGAQLSGCISSTLQARQCRSLHSLVCIVHQYTGSKQLSRGVQVTRRPGSADMVAVLHSRLLVLRSAGIISGSICTLDVLVNGAVVHLVSQRSHLQVRGGVLGGIFLEHLDGVCTLAGILGSQAGIGIHQEVIHVVIVVSSFLRLEGILTLRSLHLSAVDELTSRLDDILIISQLVVSSH